MSQVASLSTSRTSIVTRAVRVLNRSVVTVPAAVVALIVMSQVVIPLPFTPVPLSLGTLAALGVGALLGARKGALAAAIYAAAGAVGFPVLAGFGSGIMVASFGYVIGYVLAAAAVGLYAQSRSEFRWFSAGLTVVAATALVYVSGVIWMVAVFDLRFAAALSAGVIPFLIGDALKASVVLGILRAVKS